MAIKRPDIYEHNNSTKSIVDSINVRGGHHNVANVASRDAIPADKRALRMLVSYDDTGNFTSRYDGTDLTDPEWENAANWANVGGISDLTAGSGLTLSSNEIKLGGLLTEALSIDTNEWQIDFISTTATTNATFELDLHDTIASSKFNFSASEGTASYNITGTSAYVQLQHVTDSNNSSLIHVTPASILLRTRTAGANIDVTLGAIGLDYGADYSTANAANNRWIVDKEYVDGAVTGATPVDDILDWSTDKYTPFATNADGVFAIEVAYPTNTTRLNYDGYFYATQLFGSEQLNAGNTATDYGRLEDDQLNIVVSSTARTSLTPAVADGAAAIGYTFDTSNNLVNATAKLVSVQNSGVEKVFIDKDGNITSASQFRIVDTATYLSVAAGDMTFTDANAGSLTLTQLAGTAGSGLTQTVTEVKLGGTLTEALIIDTDENSIEFQSTSANNDTYFQLDLSDTYASGLFNFYSQDGGSNDWYNITGTSTNIELLHAVDSNNLSFIQVSPTDILLRTRTAASNIDVTLGSTGFLYASDYSALNAANDRWIPDKEYVDTTITAAIAATTPQDDILDWSTDRYTPYVTNADGVFATQAVYPTNTTRLNYDGYFYTTQLFGSEQVNIGNTATDYARLEDDQLNIVVSSTARTIITPTVADGGAAIAYTFDTANSLTTTAKIASFQNVGAEKAFIDNAGNITTASQFRIVDANTYLSVAAGDLTFTDANTGSKTLAELAVPFTFSNGLTEAAGAVKWGGTITEDTTLTADTFWIYYTGHGEKRFRKTVDGTSGFAQVAVIDTATGTAGVVLQATNDAGTDAKLISIHNDASEGIIIQDNIALIGMQYDDDYSDNYTTRSLVDKEYVDGAIIDGNPVDDILDWSTDKYTPYTTNAAGVFATEVAYPTETNRLNWNGNFYANQVWSSNYFNAGSSATDYARYGEDQLNIFFSSVAKLALTPGVADGGSAIAYTFDTANDLTTAGAKIASFKSAGTEKAYIDKDGNIWAGSSGTDKGFYGEDELYLSFSSTKRLDFTPNVADGASAIGYKFDTVNDLTTAGAKIVSFQSAGVEKAFIDKDGNITTTSQLRIVDNTTYIDENAGDLIFTDTNTGTKTLAELAAFTALTFVNGLTESSGVIRLGGTLSQETTIACDDNTFNITNVQGSYDTAIEHTATTYKVGTTYTTGEVYMQLDSSTDVNIYAKATATTNPNQISVTTSNIGLETEDGGIIITDHNLPGSRNLLQYAADYTGDMTDARVIPDLAKVQSLIASGGLTFNNAITQTGDIVRWGGPLVANVEIDGAFNIEIGATTPIAYFNTVVSDGTTGSEIDLSDSYAKLEYFGAVNNVTINLDPINSIVITDTENEIGAKYAADYSDNFTDRSLVDKQYVDDAITEVEDVFELIDRDIYVNGATGSDETGDGTVGTPFATLEGALGDIGDILDARITIKLLGANTYDFNQECINLLNEFEFRNAIISIEGEPELLTDSFTAAEDASLFTFDVSDETWTIDEYKGKFIKAITPQAFDNYNPIYENTTTTFKSWVNPNQIEFEVADMTTVLQMDSGITFGLLANPSITGSFTPVTNFNDFGKIQFLFLNINYPVLAEGSTVENTRNQIIGFMGCLFTKEIVADSIISWRVARNKGMMERCIFQGNTDDRDTFIFVISTGEHDLWPFRRNFLYKPGTQSDTYGIFMSGASARTVGGNIIENYEHAMQIQSGFYNFSFSDLVVKDCLYAFRNYGGCQLLFDNADVVFENTTNFFKEENTNYIFHLNEDDDNTIEGYPTNLGASKPYYISPERKIVYTGLYIEIGDLVETTLTNNTVTEITIGDKTQNRSITVDYTATRDTKIEQGLVRILYDGTTLYINNNNHDNQAGAGIGMTFDAVFNADLINLEVTIDDNVDDVTFSYDIKRKMI